MRLEFCISRRTKIVKENNISEELTTSYVGLIGAYLSLDDLTNARIYVAKSEKSLKDSPAPFYQIYFQFALSSLLEKENKLLEAKKSLEVALSIAEDGGYEGAAVSVMVNMQELNFKLNDYQEVIKNTNNILIVLEELKLKEKIIQSHKLLKKTYTKTGQYKLALHHSDLLNKEELYLTERNVKVLGEITRVERQTKETELKLFQSQKDQEILTLKLQKQSQNQLILVVSIIGGFILAFLFYYRNLSNKEIERQRNVNKQLKEPASIYVGNPVKLIKKDVRWES